MRGDHTTGANHMSVIDYSRENDSEQSSRACQNLVDLLVKKYAPEPRVRLGVLSKATSGLMEKAPPTSRLGLRDRQIDAGRKIKEAIERDLAKDQKPKLITGPMPTAPKGYDWIRPGEIPHPDSVYFTGCGGKVDSVGFEHTEPTRGPVKYAADPHWSGFARPTHRLIGRSA